MSEQLRVKYVDPDDYALEEHDWLIRYYYGRATESLDPRPVPFGESKVLPLTSVEEHRLMLDKLNKAKVVRRLGESSLNHANK